MYKTHLFLDHDIDNTANSKDVNIVFIEIELYLCEQLSCVLYVNPFIWYRIKS